MSFTKDTIYFSLSGAATVKMQLEYQTNTFQDIIKAFTENNEIKQFIKNYDQIFVSIPIQLNNYTNETQLKQLLLKQFKYVFINVDVLNLIYSQFQSSALVTYYDQQYMVYRSQFIRPELFNVNYQIKDFIKYKEQQNVNYKLNANNTKIQNYKICTDIDIIKGMSTFSSLASFKDLLSTNE